MVSVPGFTSVGAVFTSVTISVATTVALAGGTPLSVTRITTAFVLGPCASVGVQVNAPVTGSISAPVGAPGSRLKLRVWAGRSESDALTVKVIGLPSGEVVVVTGVMFGGLFTFATVTLKLLLSVFTGDPLSVTLIVIG